MREWTLRRRGVLRILSVTRGDWNGTAEQVGDAEGLLVVAGQINVEACGRDAKIGPQGDVRENRGGACVLHRDQGSHRVGFVTQGRDVRGLDFEVWNQQGRCRHLVDGADFGHCRTVDQREHKARQPSQLHGVLSRSPKVPPTMSRRRIQCRA